MTNPDLMSDEEFAAWFSASTTPSQADVDAWVRPTPVDLATAWKAAHPTATCSLAIARGLAEIEAAR